MLLTTIRTDTRYLISPQLTSSEYPDVDLDRNINRWYRTIFGWIVSIQGEWELNGEILTRDLSAGVTDYEIPSTLIRIYKAEVMYDTNTGFVPVTSISMQRNQLLAEGNSSRVIDSTSSPTIELFGDFLQLKPAATSNVVNGFKIWAQINFVDLDATTNNVPKINDLVQRCLSYGAAFDYAIAQEMYTKADKMDKLIFGDPSKEDNKGMKGLIEDLYSNRAGLRRDRVQSPRKNYR